MRQCTLEVDTRTTDSNRLLMQTLTTWRWGESEENQSLPPRPGPTQPWTERVSHRGPETTKLSECISRENKEVWEALFFIANKCRAKKCRFLDLINTISVSEYYVPRHLPVPPHDGSKPDKKLKLDWVYPLRHTNVKVHFIFFAWKTLCGQKRLSMKNLHVLDKNLGMVTRAMMLPTTYLFSWTETSCTTTELLASCLTGRSIGNCITLGILKTSHGKKSERWQLVHHQQKSKAESVSFNIFGNKKDARSVRKAQLSVSSNTNTNFQFSFRQYGCASHWIYCGNRSSWREPTAVNGKDKALEEKWSLFLPPVENFQESMINALMAPENVFFLPRLILLQMWWPHVRVWEATGNLTTLQIIGLRMLQEGVSSVAFCGAVSKI